MNISFVLAVYNKLELTKECYKHLRSVYPTIPLIISSAGSVDGTKEWCIETSSIDPNLKFVSSEQRLSFSDNYNQGIKYVDTDKLILIHNDMVIGRNLVENLEKFLTEDTLLSYTTIEPPVFKEHIRPGKVLLDLGNRFDNFNQKLFDQYIDDHCSEHKIDSGSSFFMSGYKSMWQRVGPFDGNSFYPMFCEDDDFQLRAKLNGYKLRTLSSAIVYHFVSQTSRSAPEFSGSKEFIEQNSNKNFVRKWGLPISVLHQIKYWDIDTFNLPKFRIGFESENPDISLSYEPFFDKIILPYYPFDYLRSEMNLTKLNLEDKFQNTSDVDVMITQKGSFTREDFENLSRLRLVLPNYQKGTYKLGSMVVNISNPIQ